jgi:hypothetical protein
MGVKSTKYNLIPAGSSAYSRYVAPVVVEPGVALTYVSDGDANGVAYYLATTGLTTSWANPHTAGKLTAVRSSDQSGTATNLVDRAGGNYYTANALNSWIGIDLGVGNTLTVNRYSLRGWADPSSVHLRNWKLQGSNGVTTANVAGFEAATWTDLDTKVNDTTINGADMWVSPTVTGAAAYRFLRIFQTGVNSAGNYYLVCSEFEFYGRFISA